jgi:dCMP deaminase
MLTEKKIDTYMNMAHAIKELSPDEETKVGAILLSSDQRVIASSYNGFLRGANDDILPKIRPDKHLYIQHAERNVLYNCAHEGIKTKDTILICTLSPCTECLRACYQSGISSIIFETLYKKYISTDCYKQIKDIGIQVVQIGKYTEIKMIPRKQFDLNIGKSNE